MAIPHITQGNRACPNCGVKSLYGAVFTSKICLHCGHYGDTINDILDMGRKLKHGELCPECHELTLKPLGVPCIGKLCIPCGYFEEISISPNPP